MDLAYAWLDELGVSRDAIRHQYAYEVYSKPNDITVKFFELIPNTARAISQIGDLVVFRGGTAGHISIRSSGSGDTTSFESFDQNFGTTVNKCGLIRHPYDNVLGFLRFRQPQIPELGESTKYNFGKPYGELEMQQIRSMFVAKDKRIKELESQESSPSESEPLKPSDEYIPTNSLAKLFYSLAKALDKKSVG